MKRVHKLAGVVLALVLSAAALTACVPEEPDDTTQGALKLSHASAAILVGAGVQLTARLDGEETDAVGTSSDETVATVDEDGYVTGVSVGDCTVTAAAGGEEATCAVTVGAPAEATELLLDKTALTMEIGDSATIHATVSPVTVRLYWVSSNSKVIVVSAGGVVTAVGSGTADVIVTTGGSMSARCTVTVMPGEGSVCPDFSLQRYENATGDLTDETYSPADSRGKITVINFWGTLCDPCKAELPYFDRVAAEEEDVVVVAAHSIQSMEYAPSYIEENYPESKMIFVQDEVQAGGRDVFGLLGGKNAYPHTVILDKEGTIVYMHTGSLSYDRLMEEIENAR